MREQTGGTVISGRPHTGCGCSCSGPRVRPGDREQAGRGVSRPSAPPRSPRYWIRYLLRFLISQGWLVPALHTPCTDILPYGPPRDSLNRYDR